jgi:hypothetical protein
MKLTGLGRTTVALAIGAAGVVGVAGGAQAKSHHHSLRRIHARASATDPDNVQVEDQVQSGDQTASDTPGLVSAHRAHRSHRTHKTVASVETNGSYETTGSESDGPGGHGDSGDNVDHQFDGIE